MGDVGMEMEKWIMRGGNEGERNKMYGIAFCGVMVVDGDEL